VRRERSQDSELENRRIGESAGGVQNLSGGQELELELHFLFLLEGSDELYYTAADAYTGASAEDAFVQPSSEAMTCGVRTSVSAENAALQKPGPMRWTVKF